NQGQTDAQIRFLAHGAGVDVFLRATDAVIVLPGPKATSAVLRMQLVGGNAAPTMLGVDKQSGVVSYYLGNDAANWHAGLPTYAQVEYQNVYPGVDQRYYGRGGQLEYDFDLAPGADPTAIQLAFTGADRL